MSFKGKFKRFLRTNFKSNKTRAKEIILELLKANNDLTPTTFSDNNISYKLDRDNDGYSVRYYFYRNGKATFEFTLDDTVEVNVIDSDLLYKTWEAFSL